MGCTSSAQNMAPSLANSNSDKDQNVLEETDENQIKEHNEKVTQENRNESNGIKVLPRCDNLDEPMHLDSHSKLVDTANQEKDFHGNGLDRESENENKDANHLPTNDSEDRLSHFEEVVEKVVELYENGELEIPTKSEPPSEETPTKTMQGDKDTKDDLRAHDTTDKQQEDKTEVGDTDEAEPDEIASPSQSQCSRATRWEALADIAAELPPSLAVDPITGQIYSLSK